MLSQVILNVDHDWDGSDGVLYLGSFTLPVRPGSRKGRHLPFNELINNIIFFGNKCRPLEVD